MSQRIKVALRIKPINEKESNQKRCRSVIDFIPDSSICVDGRQQFTFDYVFSGLSLQNIIFTRAAKELADKFIDGFNTTILAFGQSNSGKSYTMGMHESQDQSFEGLIPKVSRYCLDKLSHFQGNQFQITASFLEIYNEDLLDLLNQPTLKERKSNPNWYQDAVQAISIREKDGAITLFGAKEISVADIDEVLSVLQQGLNNRSTSYTKLNEQSSRSHAIFSLTLRQNRWIESPVSLFFTHMKLNDESTINDRGGDWQILMSKFNFVDLAGSERLKRTGSTGDRQKEGISINSGLTALGNVIYALSDSKVRHVPYRESKLTRLLQESLGGNSQTLMIACISPVFADMAETLNSLNYANRTRNIQNCASINSAYNSEVAALQDRISRLQKELEGWQSGDVYAQIEDTVNQNESLRIQVSQLQEEKLNIQQHAEFYSNELSLLQSEHPFSALKSPVEIGMHVASGSHWDNISDTESVISASESVKTSSSIPLPSRIIGRNKPNISVDLSKVDLEKANRKLRVVNKEAIAIAQAFETKIESLQMQLQASNIRSDKAAEQVQYVARLELRLESSTALLSRHASSINDFKSQLLQQQQEYVDSEQYIAGLEAQLLKHEELVQVVHVLEQELITGRQRLADSAGESIETKNSMRMLICKRLDVALGFQLAGEVSTLLQALKVELNQSDPLTKNITPSKLTSDIEFAAMKVRCLELEDSFGTATILLEQSESATICSNSNSDKHEALLLQVAQLELTNISQIQRLSEKEDALDRFQRLFNENDATAVARSINPIPNSPEILDLSLIDNTSDASTITDILETAESSVSPIESFVEIDSLKAYIDELEKERDDYHAKEMKSKESFSSSTNDSPAVFVDVSSDGVKYGLLPISPLENIELQELTKIQSFTIHQLQSNLDHAILKNAELQSTIGDLKVQKDEVANMRSELANMKIASRETEKPAESVMSMWKQLSKSEKIHKEQQALVSRLQQQLSDSEKNLADSKNMNDVSEERLKAMKDLESQIERYKKNLADSHQANEAFQVHGSRFLALQHQLKAREEELSTLQSTLSKEISGAQHDHILGITQTTEDKISGACENINDQSSANTDRNLAIASIFDTDTPITNFKEQTVNEGTVSVYSTEPIEQKMESLQSLLNQRASELTDATNLRDTYLAQLEDGRDLSMRLTCERNSLELKLASLDSLYSQLQIDKNVQSEFHGKERDDLKAKLEDAILKSGACEQDRNISLLRREECSLQICELQSLVSIRNDTIETLHHHSSDLQEKILALEHIAETHLSNATLLKDQLVSSTASLEEHEIARASNLVSMDRVVLQTKKDEQGIILLSNDNAELKEVMEQLTLKSQKLSQDLISKCEEHVATQLELEHYHNLTLELTRNISTLGSLKAKTIEDGMLEGASTVLAFETLIIILEDSLMMQCNQISECNQINSELQARLQYLEKGLAASKVLADHHCELQSEYLVLQSLNSIQIEAFEISNENAGKTINDLLRQAQSHEAEAHCLELKHQTNMKTIQLLQEEVGKHQEFIQSLESVKSHEIIESKENGFILDQHNKLCAELDALKIERNTMQDEFNQKVVHQQSKHLGMQESLDENAHILSNLQTLNSRNEIEIANLKQISEPRLQIALPETESKERVTYDLECIQDPPPDQHQDLIRNQNVILSVLDFADDIRDGLSPHKTTVLKPDSITMRRSMNIEGTWKGMDQMFPALSLNGITGSFFASSSTEDAARRIAILEEKIKQLYDHIKAANSELDEVIAENNLLRDRLATAVQRSKRSKLQKILKSLNI